MATSRILGPDGQPIKWADAQTPQTAHLGHLQRELQTHPARGLTPGKLASILTAAESGDLLAQYDLFEDMEEKDGHIASELGKRRRAVLVEWNIVPPDNASAAERKAAELLTELFDQFGDLEDVLFDLTDAIGKGFACLEIEWDKSGKFWLPKTITHRPQSWFTLHRGYRQELRLRTNTSEDGVPGAPLQPFGWITHIHKAKSGYMERTAMFRQLVWTYLFKNYSVGDLAEFLEIYGIPLRVGKYPSTATERDKLTLLRALSGIGHNAAGIVPEGMLLEFHNAATGDPAAFELMINWCEKNQSKVILGGTLTSGADGKSSTNALGSIHNEVRKDLRDSDIRQINNTVTRDLVYPIAALAGLAPHGLRRCPVFRLSVDEQEDLTAYADALPKLVAVGMQIPVQWAQERLGIPQPDEGEAVLQAQAPFSGGVLPMAAATAAPATGRYMAHASRGAAGLAALAGAASQKNQSVPAGPLGSEGHIMGHLAPAGKAIVADWMARILAIVQQAATVGEVESAVAAAFDELPEDELVTVMEMAFSAARLAGMEEVARSAGETA